MDDEVLFERQMATLRECLRAEPHVIERPGVWGAVAPALPDRSMMNSVVYEDADSLGGALEEVAADYEAAGIRAWSVWVPARDRAAARLLDRAGHVLDASPTVMCGVLDEMALNPALPAGVTVSTDEPLESLVTATAEPFGIDPEGFANAFSTGWAGDLTHIALLDGEPVASVMTYDHEGDCGVFWVATRAVARGRGIAGGLLTAALLVARDRGVATTSLQATAMGRPVYARLGYRDLGPIEMWERRRAG